MVAAICGIVIVMSIFTYLMWGIANRIDTMASTIVKMGDDMHAMTLAQGTMVKDIGTMSEHVVSMDRQLTAVSKNMAIITGSTTRINANMARMTHDVGRSSSMFSSPMAYFWNMGR